VEENEIRPEAVFDQFLALAERDATRYFGGIPFSRIRCPACDSDDSVFAFHKRGFDYETCLLCETLFVNPRPGLDAFRRYYREAPSIRFWANFLRLLGEDGKERSQQFLADHGLISHIWMMVAQCR